MKGPLEPRKCKLEALRASQPAEQGSERPRVRLGLKKLENYSTLDWLGAIDGQDSGRLGKRNFKPTKAHHSKLQVKKRTSR